MDCYALCQCTGKILQFVTGQEINIGTLSEDDEASAYRFVFTIQVNGASNLPR